MQNALIAIVSSFLLLTAACGDFDAPQVSRSHSASQSIEETEPSDLGYGWSTEIEATEKNGLDADYSLSDIVTSSKVKIRKDAKSCVTCHSWAKNQDRVRFCDRVDAFLEMPTVKGNNTDMPGAKPANLKKLLREWKEAGCPE